MKTCTKRYENFPFAHRSPHHDGHCALIHGHNWAFEITFVATETDKCGFVMDFGKLKELHDELVHRFDHTLVLNSGDPLAMRLKHFLREFNIDNIILVDDCSSEGIAKLVWQIANEMVVHATEARVRVREVKVFEDTKNSASYMPISLT